MFPKIHPQNTCMYQRATAKTMGEDEDQTSLRSLYDTAERQRHEIEGSYDYQSDAYQDKLCSAVNAYQKCKTLVDQLSLFSSNEGLEDVSSSEIRWVPV